VIKIIDFGTSTFCCSSKMHSTLAGTNYFMAPEVKEKKYNAKADMWGVGIMLYIMISGNPPFEEILNGSNASDTQ